MWLHVPREYLASAQAEEASTLDSDSLYQSLESSATWREKSLKPASWRRVLSKASWTTRLSGLTCSPSTAERGVALWMVSLGASPASRTVTQVSDWESSIPATSGRSLQDWYETFRLLGASSRTYQASLLTTGETYDPTYRPWVTRLRRESSQRRRSARLTFGNASSGWPTATSQDAASSQNQGHAHDGTTLTTAGLNWPTPDTAPEAPNSGSNRKGGYEKRRQMRQETRDELLLAGQAKQWGTPTHRIHKGSGPVGSKSHEHLLNRGHLDAQVLSHQAQATETAGETGSPSGRVLNPRFVEMLMGWPSGLTDYESSETESFQSWRQRHSYILQGD